MMKLIVLVCLFSVSCGIIEMAPRKKEMFGEIHPQFQQQTFGEYTEVSIAQIDSPLPDSSFLIAWAPWCPYSLYLLDALQKYTHATAVEKWRMVATSYDIEVIERVMEKRHLMLPHTKNILNGAIHGATEPERISAISQFAVGEHYTSTPLIYFKEGGRYRIVKYEFMLEVLKGFAENE